MATLNAAEKRMIAALLRWYEVRRHSWPTAMDEVTTDMVLFNSVRKALKTRERKARSA